jgi:hypothetical protein
MSSNRGVSFGFRVPGNGTLGNPEPRTPILYPTVKTAALYHFPFKSYKHCPQAPFFKKWILVNSISLCILLFDKVYMVKRE